MDQRAEQHRIVIEGLGLVSSLGHGAWPTFRALLAGRSIADRAERMPDDIGPVDMVRALGCVRIAQHGPDPSIVLAERAGREALATIGATPPTNCILGASKGAVSAWTDALRVTGLMSTGAATGLTHRPAGDAPLATALGPMGYLGHHLATRLNISITRTIVAACASSLLAVHHAREALLRSAEDGKPSARLLVISSEAALLPAFIHSYRRLGVLPPLKPAAYAGRPLDAGRHGFMLCEIGAAVLLRRLGRDQTPEPGDIELIATGAANESHDLIRHAPGMPALRRMAGELLRGRRVDVLHPHATGTVDHDPEELAALAAALDHPTMPDVYAAKGAIGHGLGTAGLASLVIACLCARTGQRPPMPWLRHPMASSLPLCAEPAEGGCSTHAVFAGGFGGHLAGALIRKFDPDRVD